jgi:hypothetical protein
MCRAPPPALQALVRVQQTAKNLDNLHRDYARLLSGRADWIMVNPD